MALLARRVSPFKSTRQCRGVSSSIAEEVIRPRQSLLKPNARLPAQFLSGFGRIKIDPEGLAQFRRAMGGFPGIVGKILQRGEELVDGGANATA